MAVVRIWGRNNGPYFQALHCVYFSGMLFASVVAKPFLSNTDLSPRFSENPETNFTRRCDTAPCDDSWENVDTDVQVPFMIAGGLSLLASIFYFLMLLTEKITKTVPVQKRRQVSMSAEAIKILNGRDKAVFVCLVFCLMCSYASSEINYFVFLSTFLIQSLGSTAQEAVVNLSVFCAVFVCGRAAGIFAITKMQPKLLLASGIALTVVSNVSLYFSHQHSTVVEITIVLAAVGLSTQYATIVSWATAHIELPGWAGTAVLLGAAIGYLLGPFVTGALFDLFGINSFMYVLSAATSLEILMFVALLVFVKTLSEKIKVRSGQ